MLGHEYAIRLRDRAEAVKYPSKSQNVRRLDICSSFDKHMVDELQNLIIEEVHNQCPGCQIDHPSQLQHPMCMFMDRHEQTNILIHEAMMNLNPYKVMEKWYPDLQELQLNDCEIVEAYTLWQSIKTNVLCGFNDMWLDNWREKVQHSWEN